MLKKRTEKEWIAAYEKQNEYINSLLYEGESVRQCLDKTSFKGRFYYPQWVATSLGRVYSLAHKRWLKMNPKGTGKHTADGWGNNYYYVNDTVSAHTLTANYFCDKTPVKKYGEDNVEVHHKVPFDINRSIIENNKASNLQYVEKKLHRKTINVLLRGKVPKNVDGTNIEAWLPTLVDSENGSVETFYNEDGVETLKLHIPIEGKRYNEYISPAIKESILREYGSEIFIDGIKPLPNGEVLVKFADGKRRIYKQ